MKRYVHSFQSFINEADDPTYYQETFYFTLLISMSKETGGSRDETKNDIRALPEILTVTLVEPEKGGVQRDLGTKYLSTLKVHVRKPKGVDKNALMKKLVLLVNNLRGVSVLRYKERKPRPRRKSFHGTYNISEGDYYQSAAHKKNLAADTAQLTTGGPQKKGGAPFNRAPKDSDWEQAPPGAPGGLEETLLDEAMITPDQLPENIVVVVDKTAAPQSYRAYYALKDTPSVPLKAGDLGRMEAGIEVYGNISATLGQDFPYEGNYVVSSVKAADKYGPLLYDVILELVGEAGLKPDTESVSDDASAVWKHYDLSRNDVFGLDLGPAGEPLPVEEYARVMPEEFALAPQKNSHLAKVYIKKAPGVLNALDKNDKLTYAANEPKPQELPDKSPSDLSRFDRLREDILIAIGAEKDDLMTFDVRPELNQKIWDGHKSVRVGVKGAMMEIVDEFLEGLEMDLDVKDVILTGSMANYNWSRFSDLDLHILIDFAEVNDNEAMVKKFFDAVRSRWNKLHNIMIKGHEVEIYVQDEHEPHTSTGVYSLKNDEWLVTPQKIKPELDAVAATKKRDAIAKEVEKLASLYDHELYERSFEMAQRIKDKLGRMRKAGLDKTGIYSPENIAFKMLRRGGDIEILFDIYTKSYDKVFSLDQ